MKIIRFKSVHKMQNIGKTLLEYICIGISKGLDGKTVVV